MTEVIKHSAGQDTILELTEAARARILFCLDENKNLGLRLSLKKTGCSGLSYVLDYVNNSHLEDIVFELTPERYIFIDKKNFPFLRGLKIDYVRQGINYKFVFDNPNQTGQCGCGESFSVAE